MGDRDEFGLPTREWSPSMNSRLEIATEKKIRALRVVSSIFKQNIETFYKFPDRSSALLHTKDKRQQYRLGVSIFNKNPKQGIAYLVNCELLENSPQAVADFLLTNDELSKQMIGEYLVNVQTFFKVQLLAYFAIGIDLAELPVDEAWRKFQGTFHLPTDQGQVDLLVEVFSELYRSTNLEVVATLRNPNTVSSLVYSLLMLNNELHSTDLKPKEKIKVEDFVESLNGVDSAGNVDGRILKRFYERVKENPFEPGSDNVTIVINLQSSIVGLNVNLALPHRRLICYCQLFIIYDIETEENFETNQCEIFLFNDLMMITKEESEDLTYCDCFPLCGVNVATSESIHNPFGIILTRRFDNSPVASFNARSEADRFQFVESLRESINEMEQMENVHIELELDGEISDILATPKQPPLLPSWMYDPLIPKITPTKAVPMKPERPNSASSSLADTPAAQKERTFSGVLKIVPPSISHSTTIEIELDSESTDESMHSAQSVITTIEMPQ